MKFRAPHQNGIIFLGGSEYVIKDHILEAPEKYMSHLFNIGYDLPLSTITNVSGNSKKYKQCADRFAKTLRIGIWQLTSDHYSGGRILMYQFAHTLAMNGAEVWVVTNRQPMWSVNYPPCQNLYHVVEGVDPIPLDLDLIITDSKDQIGRHAWEIWKYRSRQPKFICWSFETTNWVSELVPEVAKRYGDERWRHIFEDADMLIACSEMSREYLMKWIAKDIESYAIYPYTNLYAASNEVKVKLPERPYAVWCARGSDYKGGTFALKAILGIPKPFDLVAFGQPDGMKGDENHNIWRMAQHTDAEKFAYMKKAQFVMVPSLFEGFGMVPAESLSVGTPVVAFDLPIFRQCYGDRLRYAKFNDAADYCKQVADAAVNGIKIGEGDREWAIQTYGPQRMKEDVDKLPYHTLSRNRVTAHLICWWGKSVQQAIESIYPYVDQICIAFGPTEINKDSKPDNSWDLIQSYPDVDHKFTICRKPYWKNKEEMRTWCSSKTKGNYILVLDADEIWINPEHWINMGMTVGTPPWVNLWHSEKHWIHDENENVFHWGPKFGNSSACVHYRYSWFRHSYTWPHHSVPVDASGVRMLDQIKNIQIARENVTSTVIYHLGSCLDRTTMKEKLDFYYARDGINPVTRRRHDCWMNWDGKAGHVSDGHISEVTWKIPDIVRRAMECLKS